MATCMPPTSTADIEAALQFISPDIPRDDWVRVGMAIHSELGEDGFDLFDTWSSDGQTYNPAHTKSTWKSFDSGGGTTIATVFKMAKENGYQHKNKNRPHQAVLRPATPPEDEAKAIAKARAARDKAQALWDKGTACETHQYPYDKEIRPIGVRRKGQDLLVPMYDKNSRLSSIQIIKPDGTKRFLKDCPVSGLYHVIGKPANKTVIIAEGYATAVSIHMATGRCVTIAFSKGNIPKVAKIIRDKRPEFEIILAPDNDPSGDAIKKAEQAANEFGCSVIVPQFSNDVAGTDWNDLHQFAGLDEVARQVENSPLVSLSDFRAHMPDHRYIFIPTRDLWPAVSVDARLDWPVGADDKPMKPSRWLDANASVEQMTWAPGLSMLIENKLIDTGGWIDHPGCTCFNLYRPPALLHGDPNKAGPWIEHLQKVYPDDANHLIQWFAHRVQRPAEKLNHALVLGGRHGIGKDTIMEPVKFAVGPWNCHEVSPGAMLGRFNGFVKSVILRVSEARDLGDVDRFAFYDHTKALIAAPPDVIRVDEKNIREYPVPNVCGVIITTNHKSDGLYLPADDRRHFVAWSDCTREEFDADYWNTLWQWYGDGGIGHVAAYLAQLDLSGFDAKAPPPKTEAFWHIVNAARAPEESELADILDSLRWPDAVTLDLIVTQARIDHCDFAEWLSDRRNRRRIPYRMESAGYEPVRNPAAKDGYFVVNGKRHSVYTKATLSIRDRHRAAAKLNR